MSTSTLKSSRDNSSIPPPDEAEKKAVDHGATPAEVEEILWLVDFAHVQGITSFGKLAKEISVSESIVSLILRGKYPASISGFCATVKHFREVWTERQELGPVVYVPELSIVRRITQFADLVRTTQQIGIAWGKNQTGKTKALRYYAAGHKLTAYSKLPAGGATKPAMKSLALARGGIPTRKSHEELRERILRAFNPQWLIMADEFHQTIKGRTMKTVTIDRYREVHDDCECGLLLCGTDQLPEMLEDERYKDFLGQIANRGVLRLRIPTEPTARDIELIIKAYGFDGMPSGKVFSKVTAIANENGIGKLSKFFNIARRLAKKGHERLAWKHFATTTATIESWSLGKFTEQPKQLEEGSEE